MACHSQSEPLVLLVLLALLARVALLELVVLLERLELALQPVEVAAQAELLEGLAGFLQTKPHVHRTLADRVCR